MKSLQEDLDNSYMFLSLLVADIGWNRLRICFLMNSEPIISIARVVIFEEIGFPHNLKVVSYNQLDFKSLLILTMK